MKPVTKKQGHLDGLCGVYAIVNAFSEVGLKSSEDIFREACKSLSPNRWPKTLWEGTTMRDLEVMIKSCIDELKISDVVVRYPFRSQQPLSDSQFWLEFDDLFSERRKSKCAIIGFEEPSLHWLVAKPKGMSILFIDSDGFRGRSHISREEIYAGRRRSNGQEYRMDRKDVILFERLN